MLDTSANPIILLNGPPRVGKNYLAEVILGGSNVFNVTHLALTDSAKLATLAAFGMLEMEITVEDMEKVKDKPHPLLNNKTWRQAISMTLETYKAMYGGQFWAERMVRKIKALDRELLKRHGKIRTIIFITDPSFPDDIATFEEHLGDRTMLMRIHRGLRDFGKYDGYADAYGVGTGRDVRNWLFSDKLPSVDFTNDGNEQEAFHDFTQHLRTVVNPITVASDRNNKGLLTTLIGRNFKIPQTAKAEPFAKPYRVYWPQLRVNAGPVVEHMALMSTPIAQTAAE